MKKTENRDLFILINEYKKKYVCSGNHVSICGLDNLRLENLHCSERAAKTSLTKWKNYYQDEVQYCKAHINAIKDGTETFFKEAALPRFREDLKKAETNLAILKGCEIKKISVSLNYTVED